ncbi:MAG: SGNH/GDSL hydrolase family protein [Clostridia bacterium]|nr:SGNH/GDSL hydrolase family protein [Clostridia bacterium]
MRQLISFQKIPVIIFIYTTSEDSINKNGSLSGKAVENAISAQSAVAQHYGIYEVNLNDYIWEGVKQGRFIWERGQAGTLTVDGTHPNDLGYEVYANRIVEMLTKDKSEAFRKLDPDTEPYGDYVFGEIEEVFLEDESVKLTGGWSKKSYTPIDMTSNTGRYPERFFRDGYMHSDDGTKTTLEYEFTGRGIGIDYLRTKNNANLQYTVYDESGKAVKTGTTAMYYKTDTGRCCGQTLVSGLPYGKYKFVANGVLNQSAVNANKNNPNEGGSGLELNIAYLVVDKAMPKIAPHANNVKIGSAFAGSEVTASYDYSCKMYKESGSEYGFYISDSENGAYTKVSDKTTYTLKNEDLGKYIKFSVTPKNENGNVGKTAETDPVKILRPAGHISFNAPVKIKVNGKDSAMPGTGNNTFSGALANSGRLSATVQILAATYKTNGEYKTLTGMSIAAITVAPGKNEQFSIEIEASESDSEVRLMTFASDSLEPADTEQSRYIGLTSDDGTSTSVYQINYFE